MKQLFTLFAVLAFAVSAYAQNQYTVTTGQAGGTNNVAAATSGVPGAAGLAATVACTATEQENVGVLLSFKASNSSFSTDSVTFTFCGSVDGTTYSTANLFSVAVPGNGTSTVYLTTNLNVGALGYVKLLGVANTNASYYITNVAVKYSVKPVKQKR